MVNLVGKTVLLTGASRGLGKNIAHEMGKMGANLILVARSEQKLHELCAELKDKSHEQEQFFIAFAADLARPNAVGEIISKIKKNNLMVDVLINNAAIQGPIGPSWQNNWQDWQKAIQVNLLVPIELCRACVPLMMQKKYGKIINLSGGGATEARPNFSAYAVAKTGLVRFSENLAAEVAAFNIDVNCVAPGIMNSELLSEVLKAGPSVAGEKAYITALNAHEKSEFTVQRATALCIYLASSKSDKISGKLISAVWDPWENLHEHLTDLEGSDIYTLRRIVPKDRGKDWGDKK